MLIISSREFRQNQKLYFEKADKGEQIIVQRGQNKAYSLTPVNEDDVYFTAEIIEKIKQSLSEISQGKSKRITKPEEISELLGL